MEQIAEGADGEVVVFRQDETLARGSGRILVAGQAALRPLATRISRAEVGQFVAEKQVFLGPRQVDCAVRKLQAPPVSVSDEPGLKNSVVSVFWSAMEALKLSCERSPTLQERPAARLRSVPGP